jgi:hypothetical protein
MYTVLIFPGGRRADAVLLSNSTDCLRFAIAGRADVTELRRIGERWMTEAGVPVELGAFVALSAAVMPRRRALTAAMSVVS